MRSLHLARSLAFPALFLAAVACGGDDLLLPTDGSNEAPPANPTFQLQMAGGDDQIGATGTPLSQPLMVRVFDEGGNGISGQTVTWVVTAGDGNVTPASSTTNAQGLAQTTWTLGSAGPNSIDAVVSGVGSVTFSATANGVAGGGDDNGGGDTGSGNGGTGTGGTGSGGTGTGGTGGGGTGTGGTGTGGTGGGTVGTLPSASTSTVSADQGSIQTGSGAATIRVTVRDAAGLPVPGAVVTISASGIGNIVTQPSGPTGTDGVAAGTISSSVPGTKDITATVNGTLRITQTVQISVTAAPANRIVPVDGNDQTARAGQQVAVAPAVRVTDAAGRPVAGYGVTFVVTQGGGTLTGASQVTNSDGIARVGSWTLGSAGRNTLEARAGSLDGNPVVFNATATAPTPPPPPGRAAIDHLAFRVQPHDVQANETFRVEVALVDAKGEVVPVSGIFIYLDLFEDGRGTPTNTLLQGEHFENTENGIAVLDVRVLQQGRFRLRALTDDLPELGPHGPEPWLFSPTFEVR